MQLTVYNTVVITLLIEGVLTAPVPKDSGKVVSFVQKSDDSEREHQTQSAHLDNECHRLSSSSGPTTIHVKFPETADNNQYQLVGFSEKGCPESSKITHRANLNSKQPKTEVNGRKPICSYKLMRTVNNSEKDTVVTVRFSKNGKLTNHQHAAPVCHQLCLESAQNYYPDSVGVYEGNSTTELAKDNFVMLYSKPSCEDDSEIRTANGETLVNHEPNLHHLTATSPAERVESFKLVKVDE